MPKDGIPLTYPVPPEPTSLSVFLPQLPPLGQYGRFAWVVTGLLFLSCPNPRLVDLEGRGEC